MLKPDPKNTSFKTKDIMSNKMESKLQKFKMDIIWSKIHFWVLRISNILLWCILLCILAFFFKLTFECVQTMRTINKLEEINQLAEDVKSRIEKLGREIETAPIQSQRIEMAYMERNCLFEVLNRM